MKNILITSKIPEIAVSILESKGYTVDVNNTDSIPTQGQIIKLLRKKPYDAVISLLTNKIDAKIFDIAPSVKIYVNYASGFDNIDIVEAKNRGILVANPPADQSAEAVAEHTFAMIFALNKQLKVADRFVREGNFKQWDPNAFLSHQLWGQTIGIIGLGRIGTFVGQIAFGGFKYTLRMATVGDIDYVGEAAIGSATAAEAWRIKRIDSTSGVVIQWAGDDVGSAGTFDQVWNNRATLDYF